MKTVTPKVKLIRQRKNNDCGVACVAMLAGVSYSKAKKTMFPDSRAGYTDERQIKKALKSLGCVVGHKFVPVKTKKYSSLESLALLKINLRSDGGWHWVVWTGNRLLDPKQAPYKRVKLHSYLKVENSSFERNPQSGRTGGR